MRVLGFGVRTVLLLAIVGAGPDIVLGVELRDVRIDSRLVDATAAQQRDATGAASGAPAVLAGLAVRVFALRADGTEEEIDSSTDDSGRLALDLGERPLGSTIKVVAKAGDLGYLAAPIEVGTEFPATVSMFQISTEGTGLEQGILRVVTAQTQGNGEVVHVRQILSVGDRGRRVYLGVDGALITAFFPVPAGAELVTLEVNGQAAPTLEVLAVPDWGVGWGYTGPVYPDTRITGTFTIAAAIGDEVDLGVQSPIPTASLVLAVESGRFQFQADRSEANPALVSGGSPISLPRVKQVCEPWQATALPAGRAVRYFMRFMPPGTPGAAAVAPGPATADPHGVSPHSGPHAAMSRLRPGEPVPYALTLSLFDGTRYYQTSSTSPHGGEPGGGEVRPLANSRLRVEVAALDGSREAIETTTDLRGVLQLDLGTRPAESPVSVIASFEGEEYELFPPLRVGARTAPQQLMFRRTSSANDYVQDLFRVVTEQVGAIEAPAVVHVRQIQRLRNPRYELIPASTAEEARFFFPMPEGAELLTLEVNGEAVAAADPVSHAAWGYGIPLTRMIGPEASVMGTYRIPIAEGERANLGLLAPIRTESLVLALEEARFQYKGSRDSAVFQDAGISQAPGVSKTCRQWVLRAVAADTKVDAVVRYGRPPVRLRTLLISFLILLLGSGALVVGRKLATRRSSAEEGAGEQLIAQLESLELRFAQGELSRSQFDQEQARLSAAVDSSAAIAAPRLDEASRQALIDAVGRRDRTSHQVEADLRLLEETVKRYVLRNSERNG